MPRTTDVRPAPYGSALLGSATQSPDALRRRLQPLLTSLLVLTHLVGAAVVAAMWVFVMPNQTLHRADAVTLSLTWAAYVLPAVIVGAVWGTMSALRGLRWVLEGRRPTDEECRAALRTPLRLTLIQGALWAAAAVVFTVQALAVEPGLALARGVSVATGGLVVAAIAFLETEFVLRPTSALALAEVHGRRTRGMTGVRVRLVLFWGIGTAVPVLCAALAAGVALADGGVPTTRLAVVVLALCTVVLVFGLLVTVLSERAVVAPLGSLRLALERVAQGDFETEVTVFDGTELGLLQAGFNDMIAGLREREKLRDVFGRHVGRDVARAAAVEDEVRLGGHTRDVSVLFVDVIGSTAYATERSPEEVVDTLNRFLSVVVEEVDRQGGFVNKFMGDAALAVFGAPIPCDDHPRAALAAARGIAARLAEEVSDVEAGIGVGTGDAVAGNVGQESRLEYTVIGDSVNAASRLCELAKTVPGHVLVAWTAVEQAPAEEQAHWEPAGDLLLRGRPRSTAAGRLRAS